LGAAEIASDICCSVNGLAKNPAGCAWFARCKTSPSPKALRKTLEYRTDRELLVNLIDSEGRNERAGLQRMTGLGTKATDANGR
jgi:hypothetical protein